MKKLFALILALVMCLTLVACGSKSKNDSGSDAESVAKAFASAYTDGDAEGFLKYMPEALQQTLFEESGMSRDEFIETFNEYWQMLKEYEMAVSMTFVKTTEMDAEEKDELIKTLKEEYNLSVTDACYATMKMAIGEEVEEDDMPMVQIDGSWYFCGTP